MLPDNLILGLPQLWVTKQGNLGLVLGQTDSLHDAELIWYDPIESNFGIVKLENQLQRKANPTEVKVFLEFMKKILTEFSNNT